jgi:hypothetical protein
MLTLLVKTNSDKPFAKDRFKFRISLNLRPNYGTVSVDEAAVGSAVLCFVPGEPLELGFKKVPD